MIGRKISNYLENRGIKQKWLAEQLNISESIMSSMLNGKTSINAEMLYRICSVLNISSELFR